MAKRSNRYKETLATEGMALAKKPQSSMSKDFTLQFDYMDSPHEESWWDPGEVLDSRGSANDPSGPKSKQKGQQRKPKNKIVDV